MRKALPVLLSTLLLAACAPSKPVADTALPDFPYCKAFDGGFWPVETVVTGSMSGDTPYAFELCLNGSTQPAFTGNKYLGGPGYMRLRDRKTGDILQEEYFEGLDTDGSVFWSAEGRVTIVNGGQTITMGGTAR